MADILIAICVLVIIILLWVMLYDSNRFVVRHFSVTDARLQGNARGILLADLHNKQYGKKNEKLLAAIKEQNPDFILIAGDMLTAKPRASLAPSLDFLKALAAEYPIYYANGNHEYRIKIYPEKYGDMAKKFAAGLQEIGIYPLVNTKACLKELGIDIYGVEIDKEFYKRRKAPCMDADYLRGLLGEPCKEHYTILLAHNPDYFSTYADWGMDLCLSGHVHGGVVRVPIWGKGLISPSLRIFPKYDGGIFREKSATMILSRGLGMHTIPVRLFNPAEFWVIDFSKD